MGYLIPLTPQAFVNRISINRPDEANIKEISYQLFEHLTINNRHFNTTSNLELSSCGVFDALGCSDRRVFSGFTM